MAISSPFASDPLPEAGLETGEKVVHLSQSAKAKLLRDALRCACCQLSAVTVGVYGYDARRTATVDTPPDVAPWLTDKSLGRADTLDVGNCEGVPHQTPSSLATRPSSSAASLMAKAYA